MAIPRRNIIDPSKPVTCHCVSRCVRRLLLLDEHAKPPDANAEADEAVDANGEPRPTQPPRPPRDPDRWKKLLSARMVKLVELFAVDVIEWSILGNHFHLLLSTHPDLVALWTDREIAERWRTLTPDYLWRRRKKVPYHLPAQDEEIEKMLKDPKAIAHARQALADVSSFHKFLKQRLAQLVNVEDDVTGHFWEGRFKSIVTTDLDALIAHMVYIALNPVRAGLAGTFEECTFASIRDRIDELKRKIAAGNFAGEVEAAKEKLRGMKLLPALPCNPGDSVRRMETLPKGEPNPWRGGQAPPVAEGLTLSAFLNEVDRVGRTEREGKQSLAPERATVMATLEDQLGSHLATQADAHYALPAAAMATTLLTIAASYAAPIEEALSKGLANVFGNFSGGLKSVAKRAAELGRMAVWTIFDPEGIEPRRWVEAARGS